jgi:GNAT superfamily N-acetyltransferase
MDIIYRLARAQDKTALDHCLQQIIAAERPMDECLDDGFIEYYDPLEFITHENASLIVAEQGDVIIGCGAAKLKKAKHYYHYEKSLYLAMMYVADAYRGQGINREIMQRLLTWGKDKGLTNASLTVYPQNASAIRAYEKLGFEPALLEMRLRDKSTR